MSVGLKDPADAVPVEINWSDWLAGGTLSGSAWTVPAGLTITNATTAGTIARARIAGGTPGQVIEAANTVTAASGETATRSVVIRIEKL